MTDRPGIVVYFDMLDILDELTDEESGKLFRAILKYAATGEIPEFSDRGLRILWKEQQRKIDRDIERYEEKCIKSAYSTYCRECKRAETEPLPYEEWRDQVHRPVSNDLIPDRTISNDKSDIQLKQKTKQKTITEAETVTETVTGAETIAKTLKGICSRNRLEGAGEEEKTATSPHRMTEQEFNAMREERIAMLERSHTSQGASFL